ncbi:Uncharacterized protein HZ326_17005 [Fusarium oxysporum f. sp. albedinis]|nr:Uncharacterized protein HZ326_17005 [Fusarium oxysporum f. sp. albedinis]
MGIHLSPARHKASLSQDMRMGSLLFRFMARQSPPTTMEPTILLLSQLSPHRNPAAPTTLATEAVVTGEGQAAKSTHGLYPSQPAEAPSTPVIASGANRHQLMAWTWMAGIIGLVMVFE